jgi:ubiquitin carboxyl-terminal hydrolase L3
LYRQAAEQGSTEAPSEQEEVDYHYVAFSRLDDGGLVELDGDMGGPVASGVELSPGEDLLSGKVTQYIQHFIESKIDAGKGFSLLALVRDDQ